MEKIVLASHGSLATGMKSALKMIACDVDNIQAYDLDSYDSPEQIRNILSKEISNNNEDSYIIITDLLGGSVHIHLLELCQYENVVMISGMNLGLVLEIYLTQSDNLIEKIEHALSSSKSAMKLFTKERINQYLETDKEVLTDD